MGSTYLMILCFAVIMCVVRAIALNCDQGEYMDNATGECKPCSQCIKPQVPHRKCFRDQDTLCRPLPAFIPMNVQQDVPVAHITTQSAKSNVVTEPEIDLEDKWFKLTMILIIVLVITCILGVVAVLVFCIAWKQKQRKLMEESACTDPLTDDHEYPRIEQFTLMRETTDKGEPSGSHVL